MLNAKFSNVTVVKTLDKATGALWVASASGKPITQVVIDTQTAAGNKRQRIILTNVVLSSLNSSNGVNESVGMAYGPSGSKTRRRATWARG